MLARIAYSFSNLPKFYQLKINVGVGMVYAKIKKRDIFEINFQTFGYLEDLKLC